MVDLHDVLRVELHILTIVGELHAAADAQPHADADLAEKLRRLALWHAAADEERAFVVRHFEQHRPDAGAARLAGCKNFFAAEARDGKVYLPEWNVALPLAGMENTFTTIGIPDNAVTMSENGAMSCTVCRMILGVEENILLLRPEGSAEGAPMLRITVGHESDLQAGAAVRVALDYSKLLLL